MVELLRRLGSIFIDGSDDGCINRRQQWGYPRSPAALELSNTRDDRDEVSHPVRTNELLDCQHHGAGCGQAARQPNEVWAKSLFRPWGE
jgi:hypothetical protein